MTKIKKLSFISIIMLVLLFPMVFCACGQNTNTKSDEWETLTNVQKIEVIYGAGDNHKQIKEYDYIKNVRINRQEQRIVFVYSDYSHWVPTMDEDIMKPYYNQIEAPLQSTIIHFKDYESAKDYIVT